jgi:hypothetical protein
MQPSKLLVVFICLALSRCAYAEWTIAFVNSAETGRVAVCVDGLSQATIARLRVATEQQRIDSLRLFVSSTSFVSPETLPPVAGSLRLEEGRCLFLPRFPLQAGQSYRVVWTPPHGNDQAFEQILELPPRPASPPPRLVAIYPSASQLPRNILRFYLQFSTPMQQGDSWRYIELSTLDGRKLDQPFLEITEEMWDPSGTRLTLLCDPARVKRGLVPREEAGPIFKVGLDYRLTVRADWPDVEGNSLGSSTVKQFKILDDDFQQPDPRAWTIQIDHRPATKQPTAVNPRPLINGCSLHLRFPEPLDHALLGRCITPIDIHGQSLAGSIFIEEEERVWRFIPQLPLAPGRYHLDIHPILEDVAGNSVERAFEVDLAQAGLVAPPTCRLTFTIP